MDGLLIDSEPVWNDARKRMAAEYGVAWNQQDHFNVMGVSTQEWVDYMIERIGLTMPPADVEATIINHMADIYAEGIPFRPHAVEKIAWAASLYPSCIASGSPRKLIDIVSGDERVAPFMQFTLAADEVGKGKPDPAVYIETAKRLGIAPEHCLCLEDSPNGVLAAYRAGMKVINIPDPEMPLTEEESGYSDLILANLGEFTLEIIERMSANS